MASGEPPYDPIAASNSQTSTPTPSCKPSHDPNTSAAQDSQPSKASDTKQNDLMEAFLEEGEVPKTLNYLLQSDDVLIYPHGQTEPKQMDLSPNWIDYALNPLIFKGLMAKGFAFPSVIQRATLTLILSSNRHLLAQGHNGTGKTAAFAIAMLQKADSKVPFPQGICICHTRELAQQNYQVIQELGHFTDLKACMCIPQARYEPGAQLIIGTPGKLREMMMKRVFPLEHISLCVIDEADVLLDYASNMGAQIYEFTRKLPKGTQTLLFSATFPERVQKFVQQFVPNCHRIQVQQKKLSLPTILQYYVMCDSPLKKIERLSELYDTMVMGQSIIFVNTRKEAFNVAQQLRAKDHAVSLICGTQATGPERMDIEARDKVMQEFRNGETKVLVATDILSRGIDIPQVTLVINYDLPMDSGQKVNFETYLHRIGRTGRFGNKGVAISLVTSNELPTVSSIESYFNCNIPQFTSTYEELEKLIGALR